MPGKILIVDDSATIREQVRYMLKHNGFDPIEAFDGEDALMKIASHPDLLMVISDINMPHRDGLELLSAIRQDPTFSNLPFLMLTTEGTKSVIARAKLLGVSGWMVKPFNPEACLSAISHILNKAKNNVA